MEQPEHISLESCDQCGLPALTYDDSGNARCVEHATVFIPAQGVESDGDEESQHPRAPLDRAQLRNPASQGDSRAAAEE